MRRQQRVHLLEGYMKTILVVLLFLIALPASAQNFWIPAEKFNQHSDTALEGSLVVDEITGKQAYLLGVDDQIRIKVRLDGDLRQYIEKQPDFQVCSYVANYGTGVTNTVRARHPAPLNTKSHTLTSDSYSIVCSERGPIDENNILTGGLRVFSPSEGLVKIRGVLIRGTEREGSDYEYSRALGYLWGDGGITTDGKSLFYPKANTNTSNHFRSVAKAAFGSSLSQNPQGTRYVVDLDGKQPSSFSTDGLRVSDIPDKRAFFTSVVENEGAVLVARITDDRSRDRCGFIKDLVNDLNPRCSTNTCTDSSCATPNCAFIAHGKYRYKPDNPGVNTHCGVYLSGDDSDWRALFRGNNYHFVKTDRTPGGEPTQHHPESRPAYSR